MCKRDKDVIQELINRHGFLSWLRIQVDSINEQTLVLKLPIRPELTNPFQGSDGHIHGGIISTLIDTASGFALRSTFENPARMRMATIDLDTTFVQPATDDLQIEAEVVHVGGSLGSTTASVRTASGTNEVVAFGSSTYYIFKHD